MQGTADLEYCHPQNKASVDTKWCKGTVRLAVELQRQFGPWRPEPTGPCSETGDKWKVALTGGGLSGDLAFLRLLGDGPAANHTPNAVRSLSFTKKSC